jgi:hypothetical protein
MCRAVNPNAAADSLLADPETIPLMIFHERISQSLTRPEERIGLRCRFVGTQRIHATAMAVVMLVTTKNS